MKSKLIADRYANAMIRLIDPEEYPLYLEDIAYLQIIFSDKNEYAQMINSLIFPQEEKQKILNKLITNLQHQEIWQNLFKLLLKKHRFSLILKIIDELEKSIYKKQKIKKVRLTIAHEQPEEIINLIKQKIESILHISVLFKKNIDPTILGGFVAQTDSIVIDGSIRKNLVKLIHISEL